MCGIPLRNVHIKRCWRESNISSGIAWGYGEKGGTHYGMMNIKGRLFREGEGVKGKRVDGKCFPGG